LKVRNAFLSHAHNISSKAVLQPVGLVSIVTHALLTDLACDLPLRRWTPRALRSVNADTRENIDWSNWPLGLIKRHQDQSQKARAQNVDRVRRPDTHIGLALPLRHEHSFWLFCHHMDLCTSKVLSKSIRVRDF